MKDGNFDMMNETLSYFANYAGSEVDGLDGEEKIEAQMSALEELTSSSATKHVTYVEFADNSRQAVLMVAWGVEWMVSEDVSPLPKPKLDIQWIRLVANNPLTGEVDEMEVEESNIEVRALWLLALETVGREFESTY